MLSAIERKNTSRPWREVVSRPLALLLLCAFQVSSALGQPATPRIRILEELRLSAASEDFPEVTRVYVGPASQIMIPLAADLQVRLYDATGKRLSNVGRRGGGPGEFLFLGTSGWVHDTIWIADPQQLRTTFVSPDYRILRSERFPRGWISGVQRGGEIETFAPLAILNSGSLFGQVRWVPRDERGVAGEPEQAFGLRQADGTIRVVLRIPSGKSAPWAITTFACCVFNVPFAPRPQYAIASNGQLLAELAVPLPTERDGRFRVTVLRVTGDTVFSKLYPYRGEPIPQRARDSALARVVPNPGHLVNVPPDLPDRIREEARSRMPSWSAPLEAPVLGLDGTVWIEYRAQREGRLYLILDDRGEPIGELLVPPSTRVRQATASRIWVTETDADGLSDVVRYRVIGLPASGRRQ